MKTRNWNEFLVRVTDVVACINNANIALFSVNQQPNLLLENKAPNHSPAPCSWSEIKYIKSHLFQPNLPTLSWVDVYSPGPASTLSICRHPTLLRIQPTSSSPTKTQPSLTAYLFQPFWKHSIYLRIFLQLIVKKFTW